MRSASTWSDGKKKKRESVSSIARATGDEAAIVLRASLILKFVVRFSLLTPPSSFIYISYEFRDAQNSSKQSISYQ